MAENKASLDTQASISQHHLNNTCIYKSHSEMRWQLRFLRNAIFGLLPFREKLRKLKRHFVNYPNSVDKWTLEQGIRQIDILESVNYDIRGKRVMELGTGWQPIIPIVFFLGGADSLLLVDIQRLLDARAFFSTVKSLFPYFTEISERLQIPKHDLEKALNIQPDKPLPYYLKHFNMEYLAPCDVSTADLPQNSIDLIISNAVFEHIRPELLRRLLARFRFFLNENGKMVHFIDNSDHWEHGDKKISRLNFLKFSDRIFSLLSSFNPLDYQNRLRHFEYIEMFENSGYHIDFSESPVDTDALHDLEQLNISRRFQGVPGDELAILTSYIVSSKV